MILEVGCMYHEGIVFQIRELSVSFDNLLLDRVAAGYVRYLGTHIVLWTCIICPSCSGWYVG